MNWTAVWAPKAQRELERLPRADIKRILNKTSEVERDPFQYLERLVGSPFFKFRVGSYRIIVDIVNNKMVLHMLKEKKRSRVYD